jgi:hypothetical protein
MRRLAAACALLAACGAFEPDVGLQLAAQCSDGDSDGDTPVTWVADIQPLLDDECYFCHTPEGRNPIGVEVGGLDLSTYDTLRAGGVISRDRILVPGSPCRSVLVEKVREYPSFGGRMPLNGPPFLTDDEIQLIADWIAEGARVE